MKVLTKLRKKYDSYVERHNTPPPILRLSATEIEQYKQYKNGLPFYKPNPDNDLLTYRGVEVIENKGFM